MRLALLIVANVLFLGVLVDAGHKILFNVVDVASNREYAVPTKFEETVGAFKAKLSQLSKVPTDSIVLVEASGKRVGKDVGHDSDFICTEFYTEIAPKSFKMFIKGTNTL